VNYVFKVSPAWTDSYKSLTTEQKRMARAAFKTFKANPFDPSLRPHPIHSLSVAYRRTIYSVSISGKLRSVFYVSGNVVRSVDIGTHDIYG